MTIKTQILSYLQIIDMSTYTLCSDITYKHENVWSIFLSLVKVSTPARNPNANIKSP